MIAPGMKHGFFMFLPLRTKQCGLDLFGFLGVGFIHWLCTLILQSWIFKFGLLANKTATIELGPR